MSDIKERQTNNAIGFEHESLLGIVSFAMDVIGGRWKLRIIIAIANGNKRFSEIQKQVKGISGKVLSDELKKLSMTGIIIKKIENIYPVNISYKLSSSGQRLDEVVLSVAM
jgi:DNA-binding HxlR family transcriptional regulator